VAITSQRRFFPTCYGTEFTSRAILKWADQNDVPWHYIDPGKPQQNAFIESFNGSLDCVPRAGVTLLFGLGSAAVRGRRFPPGPWGQCRK